MKVLKTKHGGFCFGVKRAIDCASKLNGTGNFVLGEIIHNEYINKKLKEKGIITLDFLDENQLKSGDTILIRTHGEPKITFEKAQKLNLNIIDCTCPFVREIQKIVSEHKQKSYKIVIIGKADHPEIIGINGWCGGEAIITENSEEILNIKADKTELM